MKKIAFTFIAIGLLALAAFASNHTRTLRFDVAIDQTTFAGVGLPPMGPPQRGNTFIVLGKIFPSGTLLPGPQQNNPNDPANIGDFYCRAVFANNIPTAPGSPDLFDTQLFRFSAQNQLTSDGLESAVGPWMRSVTGGTGIYLGASGSERIEVIGTNASGGFNERVVFKLVERNDD